MQACKRGSQKLWKGGAAPKNNRHGKGIREGMRGKTILLGGRGSSARDVTGDAAEAGDVGVADPASPHRKNNSK